MAYVGRAKKRAPFINGVKHQYEVIQWTKGSTKILSRNVIDLEFGFIYWGLAYCWAMDAYDYCVTNSAHYDKQSCNWYLSRSCISNCNSSAFHSRRNYTSIIWGGNVSKLVYNSHYIFGIIQDRTHSIGCHRFCRVVYKCLTKQSCGTPCAVTFCAEHKKRHPTPSVNCGVMFS